MLTRRSLGTFKLLAKVTRVDVALSYLRVPTANHLYPQCPINFLGRRCCHKGMGVSQVLFDKQWEATAFVGPSEVVRLLFLS